MTAVGEGLAPSPPSCRLVVDTDAVAVVPAARDLGVAGFFGSELTAVDPRCHTARVVTRVELLAAAGARIAKVIRADIRWDLLAERIGDALGLDAGTTAADEPRPAVPIAEAIRI